MNHCSRNGYRNVDTRISLVVKVKAHLCTIFTPERVIGGMRTMKGGATDAETTVINWSSQSKLGHALLRVK